MPELRPTRTPLPRWLPWLLGLGLLLGVGQIAFVQASTMRFDFHHFYLDADYVWQHRALNPDLDNPELLRRRQLPFYLPTVSVLIAPIAAGGPKVGAAIWVALHLVSLAVTLRILARWTRDDGQPESPPDERSANGAAWLPLGLAVVIALPAFYEAAKFNQLSYMVMALVLCGITAVERRRTWRAGFFFGLAIVLKLLPGIFVLWLVLKREGRTLGATMICAAAIAVLPPLLLFGPQQTLAYHRQWFAHNVTGASAKGMVEEDQGLQEAVQEPLQEHFIDRRNQSIPTVISRLFWPEHRFHVEYQPLQLSRAASLRLAYGLAALLGIAWIIFTRRPGSRLAPFAWRCEAAAHLLGMLIFSPLLRQYYLVWALPGLVLLAQAALGRSGTRRITAARIGLTVWVLGMALWLSKDARLLGAHLLMLIILAGVLFHLAWETNDAVGTNAVQGGSCSDPEGVSASSRGRSP